MNEPHAVADFLADLRREQCGDVRDDAFTRVLYSTDASLYQLLPLAILVPHSVDEVQRAMELAHKYRVPVLPRAAGTSLAGQAVNEALVIDTTRHLDALLEVNPEEHWARVQPGIVLDDLNRALRSSRLQFGPDPASSDRSTMGGAVANNATGSHSLIYGMTADHVLGMEAILADGTRTRFGQGASAGNSGAALAVRHIAREMDGLIADEQNRQIIRRGTPPYWRRSGGYLLDRLLVPEPMNLAEIICGSEGTLAVMTEITINLVPTAANKGLALLLFDDVHIALDAVSPILETDPSAVELLDALSLTLCLDVPEYARLLHSVIGEQGRAMSMLIVEYQGESEFEVREAIARLRRQLSSWSAYAEIIEAVEPERQAAIWRVRKVGLGLLMSAKGSRKPLPFIEDAAVPVEHLSRYIKQIETFCGDLGIPVSYYAHASVGCLHIRPLIDLGDPREVTRMPEIARYSAELVKDYGGSLSSEHGDGRTRSWLNEAFFGTELYGLFRQVKRIFDPHNILNPGNIVDAPSMLDHLRRLPEISYRSRLDFSDYEQTSRLPLVYANDSVTTHEANSGFARAVEMCNGAGVCRQRITGTMCPSFMVTRDEAQSTRGRANALRAVLTGALPPEAMTGPDMKGIMDLCISCKACKAECPSAVDMARLKLEFLARYREQHGTKLRDRLFANVAGLSRLGSGSAASLVNRAFSSRTFRRLTARLTGITDVRPLPLPARRSFERWWQQNEASINGSVPAEAPIVALLHDPFTNFVYPEVAIAAVEFLSAVGRRLVVPSVRDEGRAFLSMGMLAEAERAARHTIAVLSAPASAGVPIVGLEPSSCLTLRDEYLYLLGGDALAEQVASATFTFEEYVDGLADTGELTVQFEDTPRTVLLHGHCHQKALVGTEPARRILSLPPGYHVTEVDSGCCGMAGAFGFEAEHYDISMQMAERRLLPAVRAAAPDTLIVAAGVSCRQQIEHGSGRKALHPAQVLRNAVTMKR